MLTKEEIRGECNPTSYSRGVNIYRSNKIFQFTVEDDGDIDYIDAQVKGSGYNIYDVSVEYDLIVDTVDKIYCECPAFAKYSGLCKHCVAVLFEYIVYCEGKEAISEKNLQQQIDLRMLESMKGTRGLKTSRPPEAKKKAQTNPVIKKLLSDQIKKKVLLINQDSIYGQVKLLPIIVGDLYGINIEFKIGITHMYVLKDVFAFVEALKNYENVAYGKKLEFIHSEEAFDLESKPFVQFICNWVERNKNRYIQENYYGNYNNYSMPKLRIIPLNGYDLSELMEALGDKKIFMDVDNTGQKDWQLTSEELPRRLTISKRDEGIQLQINNLFGYKCNGENIYFHDGKIYRIESSKLAPIREFLECMVDIPTRTVYIQKEDIPTFCRELLPVLKQHYDCKMDNFDEEEYGIEAVSFEVYLDAPQKGFITCKIMSMYGDKTYNIYNKSEDAHLRDILKEMEIDKIISYYFNAYDDKEKLMVIGDDEEKIYELLVDGIPKIQEIAEIYVTDAFKRLNIISSPKVSVGVSISGDLMELKMASDDMSKEQLIEILSKYNRKKKFYRLKNGDFVNVVGEEIETLLELKQGLGLSDKQLKQNTIEVPKYRALYLDSEFKERQSLSVTKGKDFKTLIRNMKTIEDNDFDIPDFLTNVLREYQKRGYLWIKTLHHNGFAGILADDMGLGKTLQVICYLLSEHLEADNKDNKRVLIICPASLVFNWNSEFNKFAPQLPVKMVIGTSKERQEIIENMKSSDILITSYDLLKRDIECYKDIRFHSEIIDEAQYIKNFKTQAAKSVKMVKAGFKLALTGTPIENRLSELWSIFDYLMPGYLYSYQKFREELEIPIVQNQDKLAVKRLQKMITPFVLRRLKKDVLTDLPDKLEESLYAKMESGQEKLYDAHVKKLQILLDKQSDEEFKTSKIQILSELTKLRQICCDPSLIYEDYNEGSAKTEMCIDLINNAISGGHKVILFSQFTSVLDILQERLQKEKVKLYTLTGATSMEKRAKMVEEFNEDDTPLFCISLKAGGTGLNLTSADIVIHYDPWWNIAVQNQATDRAHRIGQKNVVSVYKLIVKGTIEENIMKLQDKKSELAEQVLSGEGINIGKFSKEELLELF